MYGVRGGGLKLGLLSTWGLCVFACRSLGYPFHLITRFKNLVGGGGDTSWMLVLKLPIFEKKGKFFTVIGI